MSAQGSDRLVQFYEEIVNGNAPERIEEFCTEDFVEHEEFPGIPNNRDGVRQFFEMMRAAFPDLHMTPESVVEEGDRVVARFRMTGTHQGEFMGVPATGRHVDVSGYDEVRIVDGRAIEHWGTLDAMTLMQQLGAIPEGAPAG
jgi:steroid delta-isomerase-like uncharacterized protein